MVVIIGYGMIFIMPLLGGVDMAHTKCVGLAGVGPCAMGHHDMSVPPPIFSGVGAPGGAFRPPLPFFMVWAHPVATYAGCSVSSCHMLSRLWFMKSKAPHVMFPSNPERENHMSAL